MLNVAESLELSDDVLFSSIALENGDIYPRMLEIAKQSKLNERDTPPGWEHLKQLLDTKL